MVEDRVTDGTRIAELLASELSGRKIGPLTAVCVVDADPDAEPAPEGTRAYAVTVDDDRVARVWLFPEWVTLELIVDPAGTRELVRESELPVADQSGEGSVGVRIESGAAVKRAVDVLVDAIDRTRNE